ncbi:MAG: hypothetical protein HFH92_08855 [Lachnospiraceae bacterium]|uniref:hypothetical protein n=1 Tax=uncultured Acetatifactor sp. TaxID=1671927 RepID=UPI002609FBA7|nr:hypothetical protein [uncultured Acetatifactor sp.]MCI8789201.1 hypothetical protein [Lachnospiraceae bacterium]
MGRKWRMFVELTRKCYMAMAGLEEAYGCWDEAFEALKAAVAAERGRAGAHGGAVSAGRGDGLRI